jgi:hypothetical protein
VVDWLYGGGESDWFLLNNLDQQNAGPGESIDLCS